MPLTDEELKQVDIKKLLADRPKKDIYYLSIAFVVAQASFDPSSKCGAVIVSKDGRLLSTGFNGPIKKSKDEEVPLTRPNKYLHWVHAEENSILAYNGSYQDIAGATIFVTGRPCSRCLRGIIQKGITRIVYGRNVTHVVDQEDMDAQEIMLRHHPEVEVVEIRDNTDIQMLLRRTDEYIENKKKMKSNYEEGK
jgi:dCMP deaminase